MVFSGESLVSGFYVAYKNASRMNDCELNCDVIFANIVINIDISQHTPIIGAPGQSRSEWRADDYPTAHIHTAFIRTPETHIGDMLH